MTPPLPRRSEVLTFSRGLKSGKVDDVPLTENELVKLIADAANALRIIRGLR